MLNFLTSLLFYNSLLHNFSLSSQRIVQNITVLYLSREFDGALNRDYFSRYPYIQNFYCTYCRVTTIEYSAFADLKNLKTIKFLYGLSNIQNDSFKGLFTLEELDLAGNEIPVIFNFCFYDMISLRDLQLSYNRIQIIEREAFAGLTNLEILNLGANRIRHITNGTFLNLKNLKKLQLDANEIIEIESFYGLVNLQSLYLFANRIKSIPSYLFFYVRNRLRIDIDDQAVSIIETRAFNGNISIINLDSNILVTIQRHSFVELPNLTNLSISRNLLKEFKSDHFEFKLVSLTELILRHNHISYIDSFDKFPNVRKIDLSFNQIRRLVPCIFVNNTYLSSLDISNNYLSDIFDSTFCNLPYLKELNLEYNYIHKLKRSYFSGLYNLETLNIANNKIYELDSDVFDSINFLRVINLNGNYLKKFLIGNNVNMLLLRDNQIDIIPMPKTNSILKYLDLENNNIKHVKNDDFRYFNNLEYLYLSFNPIEHLDLNLSNIRQLKGLRLRSINTRIVQNQNLNLTNLRFLTELDLSDNNLVLTNFTLFNIEKLYLKNASLRTIRVLNLRENLALTELDLSNNVLETRSTEYVFLRSLGRLKILKLSGLNLSTTVFSIINRNNNDFHVIDFSYNNLEVLSAIRLSANHLNLSHNPIRHIFDTRPNYFHSSYNIRDSLILRNSFVYDLRNLQTNCFALICDFSSNNLRLTPGLKPDMNYLDMHNNQIDFLALHLSFSIVHSEIVFINLADNKIESFEEGVFKKTPVLEYLDLSINNLTFENISLSIFSDLRHLSFLNLSYNHIKFIKQNSFMNLNKLKILDLSFNNILRIHQYSIYNLNILYDFYLHGNNADLIIEQYAMNKINSLKNIYVSKRVFDNLENICFFSRSLRPNKVEQRLDIEYFDSLNILTVDNYTCDLTLLFIRYNIHYNLKLDYQFNSYIENSCDEKFASMRKTYENLTEKCAN